MGNLYGFLGPIGNQELALVSLSAEMQGTLGDIFALYEDQFLEDVQETLGFEGGYSPDPHQITAMPLTVEMAELVRQIDLGAIGRDRYDPRQRPPEELRALAWSIEDQGQRRILLQNFTRAQTLSRRITLWFDGETFTRLQDPALLIGNKIDAIIEGGMVKFKKFGVLKQMFDMFEVYREATDQDIRDFAQLDNIEIEDVNALCASANRTARKLIFSVARSGILQQKTTAEIRDSAAAMDIAIEVEDDKIVIPAAGPELTSVLKFLDHSIYRSPLTNERWLANSRRRLGA